MACRCRELTVQRIVFANAYRSDSRGQRGRTIVLHSAESATRVAIDVCAPTALASLLWQLIAKDGARKDKVGR